MLGKRICWDVSLSEKLIRVANTKEFMIKGKKERVIPINEKLFKLLSNKLPKYYTLQEPEYVFNKNGFRFKTIFQKVLRKQWEQQKELIRDYIFIV